ncbi:MAG: sugar phosphate isomerase/epimerase family protein [Gemmataceae bacterium]
MHDPIPRRQFLAATAAVLTANALPAAEDLKPAKTPNGFKKAVKVYMVQEPSAKTLLEKFQLLRDLGFDGIELDAPSNLKVDEVLAAKEKTGLEIPGVVDSVHWGDTLSHPDAKVRARGVKGLEKALDDAKAYGGTTVLLVPAVVNKQVSYDEAWKRSIVEIKKVLPKCEKLGVKIAIENVWNNFLLSPLEMAHYIDEFKSEHIGVHFDVGNIVLYGWPEQWIRVLGKRIFKLDIKEYSRKRCDNEGRGKGFDVPLLKGDCDWPAVMKALKEIGYVGWGAAEIAGGNREYLAGVARDMNTIFGY